MPRDDNAPRSRRPLTNAQRKALAEAWLAPLKEGRSELTLKELRWHFRDSDIMERRLLDAKTIKAGIAEAFRARLVALTDGPMANLPDYWRDHKLEDDLTRKWPNIQHAIVVNSDDLKDSNTVHRLLGAELAGYIQKNSSSYFRQNDIIGIGSGRSVYHLIASFDPVPSRQFRVHNIKIMSLSGSMYPDARAGGRLWFEADATASMFASCFAYPPLVRIIAYPLVHADVESVRVNTWLHDPEVSDREYHKDFADNAFLNHIPTHAFVGVGVLNTDHRLYHEYSSQEQSTMLRPIRRRLAKLIEISQIIQNRSGDIEPPYHPCGDMCNRIFYVTPPDTKLVRETERIELLRSIKFVNDRVLTVTKTQLSMATQLVLVSGTPQKAWTIRRLLEGRTVTDPKRKPVRLRFNLLCTDAETAQFLLREVCT